MKLLDAIMCFVMSLQVRNTKVSVVVLGRVECKGQERLFALHARHGLDFPLNKIK